MATSYTYLTEKKAVERARKEVIEKACKWLVEKQVFSSPDSDWANEFKKDME